MSREAWGEEPPGSEYDHLIEEGWMTADQAKEVTEAIDVLFTTPVFDSVEKGDEPGTMKVAVNRNFMMAMIHLRLVAGMDIESWMSDAAFAHFEATGRIGDAVRAGAITGLLDAPEDPPLPASLQGVAGPDPMFRPHDVSGGSILD